METLLVIGRSGVIQKEMVFSGAVNLQESFEAVLAELLPSHKEMAYGSLVWSENNLEGKRLLYAIPEKKLKDILDSLTKIGIAVDEVVTEDQCLSWFFQSKSISEELVLAIDRTVERTLYIVLKGKSIVLSGAYTQDYENEGNVFSEISFSLLQSGLKPVKVILSGMTPDEKAKAASFFEFPLNIEEQRELPISTLGARHWKNFPIASLLPKEQKLQKWTRSRKDRIKHFITANIVFIATLFLFGTTHLFFMQNKNSALARQVDNLMPEVIQLKKISVKLQKVHQAEESKRRVLGLFSEAAREVSPAIRLVELQINEKDIVFRGESPSHTLVSDTAQNCEKIKLIQDVKIEHTRMRKRLNQDFLEFEITAKWKQGL